MKKGLGFNSKCNSSSNLLKYRISSLSGPQRKHAAEEGTFYLKKSFAYSQKGNIARVVLH